MSGFDLFMWAFIILLVGQGLMFAIAPGRAAQYQLWKYRLIGARPAAPGPGTLHLYRIGGVAMLAIATFILVKFLSE